MSGGPATRRRFSTLPAVLATAAALLVAAGSAAGGEERPGAITTLDAVRIHLESLHGEPPVPPEKVAKRLADLGPRAVPILVATQQVYRDRDQVEVVATALRRLDPGELDRYLLSFVSGDGNDPGRGTAYRLLGEFGSAAAVPGLIAVMDENHPHTKRSAELALIELLRRHDQKPTYDAVAEALPKGSDETRARVICSIGDTDSAHGMHLLMGLLGRWSKLDLAVVSAIAQMPDAVPAPEIVPLLRDLVESRDSELRREAVTALGLFRDADSAALLIDLLAEQNEGIRGNAHWALKNISGLKFPEDPARWRLWHTEELAWWETEGKRLLALLEDGTAEEILEALEAFAERPLFQGKLARTLAMLAEHEDPRVRSAAVAMLGKPRQEKTDAGRDLTAALAARGIYPAPDRPRPSAAPPSAAPETPSRSRNLLWIVGAFVVTALFLRVFGLSMLDRIRKLWTAPDKVDGPVTVQLKQRGDRAPHRTG